VAASDYTERIAAVAERITEARDQATVHALLTEGVHALGAENAVFVSFIRDNADLSACRFMLVCEPDWCQRYLEAGCFAHDPWLAYAAHHSEPIPASTLPVLDAEGRRVIALAMENGFASAALVPAAPAASWRASSADIRIDSFTAVALDGCSVDSTMRLPSSSAASPRSRATALRTSTETLTRSARARATSAAFKPRISTVTKSWAVVFMSRRMEDREALVKPAAGRLSLHSPMHSVLASIEVTGPMISRPESSKWWPLARWHTPQRRR
jgi:hypothetical protein